MARWAASQETVSLRVVVRQLTTTPIPLLPSVAPEWARIIGHSQDLLLAIQDEERSVPNSEAASLVQKLKTHVSSLLQDRSVDARFAGILLAKAFVEVGGVQHLQNIGPWVRTLNTIINKPESSRVKSLVIITLTRIFLLTHTSPPLVRELNTPSLPGFIASCLNSTKKVNERARGISTSTFVTILECFAELLPLHPTLFRPFLSQIQGVVLPLLAPTTADVARDSSGHPTKAASVSARKVFVLLSLCSPKNSSSDDRLKVLEDVMTSAHKTADILFRSVREDRHKPAPLRTSDLSGNALEACGDSHPEPLALLPWKGINAGSQRLGGLLSTVSTFLRYRSETPFSLPVGEIYGLLRRLLVVTPRYLNQNFGQNLSTSKDGQELLSVCLPDLHASVLNTFSLLCSRMTDHSAALGLSILDIILYTIASYANPDEIVRVAAYDTISDILQNYGPAIPQKTLDLLDSCIKLSCEDILSTSVKAQKQRDDLSALQGRQIRQGSIKYKTDQYGKAEDSSRYTSALTKSATKLLCRVLLRLPAGALPFSLRQVIDRTAILSRNEDLMFACTTNAPTKSNGLALASSILPLLARTLPKSTTTDLLLRPQMLPINVAEEAQSLHIPDQPASRDDIDDRVVRGTNYSAEDPTASGSEETPTSNLQRERTNATMTVPQENGDAFPSHVDKRRKFAHDNADLNFADFSSETGTYGEKVEPVAKAPESQIPLGEEENTSHASVADTNRNWAKAWPSDSDMHQGKESSILNPTTDDPSQVQNTGRSDDSESDFEMPKLEMDSTSDDQDDEEEEEEGDEEVGRGEAEEAEDNVQDKEDQIMDE